MVALAWEGSTPELAGSALADYVACPVRMALARACGVSGAGAALLYVREITGSGGQPWSR